MKFKSIVSQKAFWKSVAFLGISFSVIFNLISILFEYGSLDFTQYYQDHIAGGKIIRFLLGQLFGAFLYGFILAFGQFRTRERKK